MRLISCTRFGHTLLVASRGRLREQKTYYDLYINVFLSADQARMYTVCAVRS